MPSRKETASTDQWLLEMSMCVSERRKLQWPRRGRNRCRYDRMIEVAGEKREDRVEDGDEKRLAEKHGYGFRTFLRGGLNRTGVWQQCPATTGVLKSPNRLVWVHIGALRQPAFRAWTALQHCNSGRGSSRDATVPVDRNSPCPSSLACCSPRRDLFGGQKQRCRES